MFILYDQNEEATNPEVIKRLKQTFPNIQSSELECGDVNIVLDDGTVIAIERKRAGDFLGSIADGRLFRQVERMAKSAKWSCIVVEGEISFDKHDMCEVDGKATNWKGVSVRAAMMAVMWSGCPILFTRKQDYPYIIVEIMKFCSKPDEHYQSLGRNRIVTFPPIELKEEILSAFPGIGLKKARSLFEFIGSKNKGEATLAHALGWVSIFPMIAPKGRPEGWGDKIVQNFRTALGLKPDEYLDVRIDEKKGNKK